MTESVNLNLLENSHAFVREAIAKAIAAQRDVHQWQFAILALVQSAELSLKAALEAIHPVLIYENVDRPSRTTTLRAALSRLENPLIGGIVFSERDKRRIDRASKLRGRVTHATFELTAEHAAANFFELFGFISDFQRRHLSTELSKIIPASDFDALVAIKQAIEELVRRALERIAAEHIHPTQIWACPNCGEDTFVIGGAHRCYACAYTDPVVECPQCSELCFQSELESFVDALDTYWEEGQEMIHNSFGYSSFDACPNCAPAVRSEIQDRREIEEMYRLEEEYRRQR